MTFPLYFLIGLGLVLLAVVMLGAAVGITDEPFGEDDYGPIGTLLFLLFLGWGLLVVLLIVGGPVWLLFELGKYLGRILKKAEKPKETS